MKQDYLILSEGKYIKLPKTFRPSSMEGFVYDESLFGAYEEVRRHPSGVIYSRTVNHAGGTQSEGFYVLEACSCGDIVRLGCLMTSENQTIR